MVENYTSIKERLRQFAKKQGVSYEKLYKIIEMTDGSFKGNAINRSLNSDAIVKFYTNFPDVDLHWLITGEEKEHQNLVLEENENYQLSEKGVPYYDVEFTAGFDFVENNQDNKPSKYISHPDFAQSEFVVRNSGQSMAKVIKHGDSIGLIHLPMWTEFLALGEIYAIVLQDNRRLVKVITKGDSKDTYTLLSKPMESKRDEFPPQQIKKSFIKHVFKVDACSSKF